MVSWSHLQASPHLSGTMIKHHVTVNFTNGQLHSGDGIHFGMYAHNKSEQKRKILVAETDDLTYVGKTDDIMAPKSDMYAMKHMVAIFDKTTQKVRIYESEMFNLQPQVQRPEDEEDDNVPKLNYREKVDLLTEAFGGAKKKRAMQSRKKNEVMSSKMEGVIHKAATEALETTTVLEEPQVQEAHPLNDVLPAYNMKAENVRDAFPFENIISDEVLEACKIAGQELANAPGEMIAQWQTEEKYPSYILNYLKRLPLGQEARLRKAACLVYLNHLIFMFRATFRELRKKDFLPIVMPRVVKDTLLNNFTLRTAPVGQRPTISMPARLKDRVLSYLMLLCLHLDEFILELKPLIVDLKISITRLQNHLQAIGCKITTNKETKALIVTLSTPLKFADTPFNQKKRR